MHDRSHADEERGNTGCRQLGQFPEADAKAATEKETTRGRDEFVCEGDTFGICIGDSSVKIREVAECECCKPAPKEESTEQRRWALVSRVGIRHQLEQRALAG
ncbi:hypothetical protein C487_09483, partial [Natrinema pallidum DSM 3751]